MSLGFRSCQTISTMRRPEAAQSRMWFESAAGIELPPVSVMPMESAIDVMVLAVPMVMQVP